MRSPLRKVLIFSGRLAERHLAQSVVAFPQQRLFLQCACSCSQAAPGEHMS
jgi:hypothetical protein